MKNYSSKRAGKGKLAYRTPDRFISAATSTKQTCFIYRKYKKIVKNRAGKKGRDFHRNSFSA